MSGHLLILSCGGAKRAQAAPARDLYTGSLFRAGLRYTDAQVAKGKADAIRILSAKYGLLELGQVIEPYDLWLGAIARRKTTAKDWDVLVLQVRARLQELAPTTVTILGGELYVELVRMCAPRSATVQDPLKGFTQGMRLQWFRLQRELASKETP